MSSRFKPIKRNKDEPDQKTILETLLGKLGNINPYDLDRKTSQQLRDCISE